MKKPLLLLLLCLICCKSFSFSGDTLQTYLNADFKTTDKTHAVYNGVAIRAGNHWYQVYVYPNGKPLLKAYFKDKKHAVKDGLYRLFDENGNRLNEGSFLNNVQEGVWKYYYKSGKLKDSGLVVHGRMAGVWKRWHENGVLKELANYPSIDSLEKLPEIAITSPLIITEFPQSFLQGMYTSYHDNGNLDSKGLYNDNEKEGKWTFYHNNGAISSIENYQTSRVFSMECFDSTGTKTGESCPIVTEPYPVLGRYVDFKTYLFDHIVWPKELLNQEINGRVSGHYTITKNGEFTDFVITESVHELLSKETERFYRSIAQWEPGISHNRNVDRTVSFSIPFVRLIIDMK